MRPSRITIVGLAGLVALHVFMLAGHGRGHDALMGVPVAAGHGGFSTSMSASPSLSTPMPPDQDGAGIDMTVACLAMLAGLFLLLPGRRGQAATGAPERPTAIRHPACPERAGTRTRSLAELCISLT
jgi:hypothetical protein